MLSHADLNLEQHDPSLLALHNRLHQPREPWSGRLVGQTFEARWGVPVQVTEPSRSVLLAVADGFVRMAFAFSGLQPWLPLSTLDPEADALLMELALLELIEPLESVLGAPLQVCVADQPPAVFALGLGVEFSVGSAAACHVQLDLSQGAAALIADRLLPRARPRLDTVAALALFLGVESGHAWLSLGEWRGLSPGDVVMLQTPVPAVASLVLGEAIRARVELHGEQSVRLLEPLNFVNPTLENPMNPPDVMQTVDETLNDLPLKLVCQLGSVELSLAQVQQLGVGSLVALTTQVHEAVDLVINGRRVGRGQLVQIGDGLGVRVQSFATP